MEGATTAGPAAGGTKHCQYLLACLAVYVRLQLAHLPGSIAALVAGAAAATMHVEAAPCINARCARECLGSVDGRCKPMKETLTDTDIHGHMIHRCWVCTLSPHGL